MTVRFFVKSKRKVKKSWTSRIKTNVGHRNGNVVHDNELNKNRFFSKNQFVRCNAISYTSNIIRDRFGPRLIKEIAAVKVVVKHKLCLGPRSFRSLGACPYIFIVKHYSKLYCVACNLSFY